MPSQQGGQAVKASGTSLYLKDQVGEQSDCQASVSSKRPVIDSLQC